MKTKRFFLNLGTIILSALISGSSAGSEHQSLKHHSAHDSIFVEKIVFRSDRYGPTGEICMMNPNGSDLKRLTTNTATDRCPCISPDGKKISFTSNRSGNYEVYIMNTDGSNPQRLTNSPEEEAHTDWYPDGSKIAFSRHYSFTSSNIFVINTDGTNEQPITNNAGHNMGPQWSADGTKILFNSTRDGNHELYTMNADGSNQQRLLFSSVEKTFPRWSPDGSKITYSALNFVTLKGAIHVMNADGTNDVAITAETAINEGSRWSPDGSQIVFQTDRNGNFEIYTMNNDGSNQRRLTNHPAWDENPAWGAIQVPTRVKDGFGELPQDSKLYQNYPNPFNSTTTFRYHLSHSAKLSLQIFDVMGRLVHTLIDQQQPAGDYQIGWDGTDNNGMQVSTGVYLCQLAVDQYARANKLILIK